MQLLMVGIFEILLVSTAVAESNQQSSQPFWLTIFPSAWLFEGILCAHPSSYRFAFLQKGKYKGSKAGSHLFVDFRTGFPVAILVFIHCPTVVFWHGCGCPGWAGNRWKSVSTFFIWVIKTLLPLHNQICLSPAWVSFSSQRIVLGARIVCHTAVWETGNYAWLGQTALDEPLW